jgi:CHAD domain-containing protein
MLFTSQVAGSLPVPFPLPERRGGKAVVHLAPKRARRTTGARLTVRHLVTTEPWFAQALRSRWELYRTRVEEYREHPSAETVHQVRVASRRLASQLVLAGRVVAGRKAHKARRMLKRQLQSLGGLRDLHIQRIFFDRQSTRFPELTLLRHHLQRREREVDQPASRRISGSKIRKLGQWIDRLVAELIQASSDASKRQKLAAIALCAAEEAFSETVRRRRLILSSDLGTIHRTRVAFKRFRYLVECLPRELCGLSRRELRRLAYYQRQMGSIQDLEVIHKRIQEFIREDQARETPLRPFRAYLRRRQARALGVFLKSGDQLFQFWPPPGLRETLQSRPACCAA